MHGCAHCNHPRWTQVGSPWRLAAPEWAGGNAAATSPNLKVQMRSYPVGYAALGARLVRTADCGQGHKQALGGGGSDRLAGMPAPEGPMLRTGVRYLCMACMCTISSHTAWQHPCVCNARHEASQLTALQDPIQWEETPKWRSLLQAAGDR